MLEYQKTVSKLDKTYLLILNLLFDDEDEKSKIRLISDFQKIIESIVVLESSLSIILLAHLLDILKDDIRH